MYKKTIMSLVLFSMLGIQTEAQTDYNKVPDVTKVILINDVYIHQNPVDSFGIGDILIEDGVIKEIAHQIEAPYNAKQIEGDSAHAYAAFIDAFSNTGIPKPERSRERPRVDFPGFPPNAIAGISPELKASDMIVSKDKTIEAMKKEGFAVAHVVPYGRMLPGQGAIISLNGKDAEEMILKNQHSALFQLVGARGVYPATVIAVMSKWRDLYKNAELYNKNRKKYAENPIGQTRPNSDECLEALVPVTLGKRPVYTKANKSKDLYRAMALQQELDYPLVLADVKQADAAMEALKNGKVHVVLSIDLPKEEKKKDSKKGRSKKGESKDKGDKPEKESKDKEDKPGKESDPIAKALKERKDKSAKQYVAQAARLEKEGVHFAFSTMSSSPKELKASLNRMIKAGLSESAALSALTVDAAVLLGIDNICGTLEKGKMANLFISTEKYFEKESSIKYMFVEGEMTEYEIKKKKENTSAEVEGNLLGEWSYTVTMEQDQTGVFDISEQDGDMVIKVIDDENQDEPIDAVDIKFEDSVLTFTITIPGEGAAMPVSLSLDVSGDTFSGTVSVAEFGSFPIEGSKISSPDKE